MSFIFFPSSVSLILLSQPSQNFVQSSAVQSAFNIIENLGDKHCIITQRIS